MRNKDVKLISFEASFDFHKNMKKLVKKLPHVNSLSQLLRQSVLDFESNLENSNYAIKGKSDTSEIKNLIIEISSKLDENNSAVLSSLILISNHLKIESSTEVNTYLDKISEALFIDNLTRTLKVKIPNHLIGLLRYNYHADYLSDWLDHMQQLEILHILKGKIIWNQKKIKELYK